MWSIPSHLVKSRETVVLETALVAHTGCMFFFLLLFFVCSIWQKQTTAGPVMGAGRVLIAPFFCSKTLSRAVIITTGILTTLATPADCPPDSFPKCTSSEISLNNSMFEYNKETATRARKKLDADYCRLWKD